MNDLRGSLWDGFEQEVEMMQIEVAALDDDVEFSGEAGMSARTCFCKGFMWLLAGGARMAEWAHQQQVEDFMTMQGGGRCDILADNMADSSAKILQKANVAAKIFNKDVRFVAEWFC